MNRGSSGLMAVFAIFGIIALGTVGFLFYQNQQLQNKVSALPSPTPYLADTPTATVPTPTVSASPSSSAVVVFESKASIPAVDLDQLQKRIINPFLDYHKEANGSDYVTSFTVSINTQASKTTYPYQAKGIFKVGAYNDFLIEKNAGGIVWWLPECLNGCNLSPEFKAKYPEIAAKVN